MALPVSPVLRASRPSTSVLPRWASLPIVVWSGCTGTVEVQVAPGCGDGLPDADEACDEGAANSNTEADACRVTCVLAACGDGVVDDGEACDDGARLGGDGCDPLCGAETGTLEAEPNESWDAATPVGAGGVAGSLSADDLDCWSFPVARCDAITVTESAPCTRGLSLSLHDPTGALLAVGAPGGEGDTAEETGGCTSLDPADQPGARWVGEGTWAVCASSVAASAGVSVDGYALTIAVGPSTGLAAPLGGSDGDGDGAPDSCDADRDGDGVDDIDDDCPDVSNGPATPAPALSADGFVTDWLAVGPFVGGASTLDCRPSEDAFVGEDAAIAPVLGDAAGDLSWTAWVLDSNSFDLLNFASIGAPREAYALVYLESPTARTLTLAVGADDGVFAWWNGVRVLDVSACQGVNADQFTASVEVLAGVNTLLFKVRDQGGGWGLAARFYAANGARVTDLVPSLSPAGGWAPGQSDRDGDGVGDYCDSEP